MKINRKIINRVTSIILSAALMLDSLQIAGISDYLPQVFKSSAAITAAADYSPSVASTEFDGKTAYNFNDTDKFIAYCYYYSTIEAFAKEHQSDSITIAINNSNTVLGEEYTGLGSKKYPFEGIVTLGSTGSYSMSAHRAFFNYLSDKAVIKGTNDDAFTFILNRLSDVDNDSSAPVLADHVVHSSDVESPAKWSIQVTGSHIFSGAIGEICEGALVDLTFINNTGNNVVSNASDDLADVGMFCGKIGDNASLAVNYQGSIDKAVTSANGNAGGLVGSIGEGSVLNITGIADISAAVTANGSGDDSGYAGGLVGKLDSSARVTLSGSADLSSLTIGGTVTGTNGAGGSYGYYKYLEDSTLDLNNYNVTAQSYGKYCGGLFGVLETSADLTITNNGDTAKAYSSNSGGTYDKTGYYGGIAGKFVTSKLSNTTTLLNFNISSTSKAEFNAFGGVFGIVDSAAYINVDKVTVNATGTNKRSDISDDDCPNYAYFGGLIGAASQSSGVFVDLGDFTLKTNEDFRGGGVVGQFYNGVLRLSGTTDMSGAKPQGTFSTSTDNADKERHYGQLVGYNDNVLVYALGNGSDDNWTFNRSNGAVSDDLGTWGEVVRISNAEKDVVEFDKSAHTVTVKSAVTSMSSQADFVKTALNIQFNQGKNYDCLLFDNGSTRDTLLGGSLSLTEDISLVGTGITGFMRDGSDSITEYEIGDVGTFAGTLNGGGKTIILATGESYGIYTESQTEGTGQIYRHRYNGLFSVVGNGTVNDLTIDGEITVRNAGMNGMLVGGAVARTHGSAAFNNITAQQTINYHEGANVVGTDTFGKNVGGLVGFVDSTDSTITILGKSNVSPMINLTGNHDTWSVCGGVIGKITADKFNVKIGETGDEANKLTVGAEINIANVGNKGSNSNSGGLIGYIVNVKYGDDIKTNYAERTVDLNNIEFTDCKVGNAATTNGGGFLGYAWLNTTANLNGVTINGDSTISGTSTKSVGTLCYSATGKWKVDSLNIEKMSMSDCGSDSVGMLVNKAFHTQTIVVENGNKSITHGLYLDVLNSGYKLSTDITLSNSISKFDEIAAYSANSADDVLNGSYGVISINMNGDRNGTEAKVTETGTYQNQLTSLSDKFANPTSRYYYNLDVCKSTDGAQNILLWSVSKYAAKNIKDEFETSISDNISGTADMTGLSFYPVPKADECTIGDLTITFDYSSMYSSEETNDTDSYKRDPGANDDSRNQHYLMHSGLFLNSTVGGKLTINGKLSLNGNFLEDDEHSGVLISDTMRGILDSTNGSVVLNGITAKTTGNQNYSNGYLLINNIKRDNSVDTVPKLRLYNVSTGSYSESTVAKSLIGPAVGPGLDMEFSKIKIDGRITSDSNNALDEAYNTKHSIFSESTLINSIRTNQNAQLIYNYTYDEDWGNGNRNVTYGYEVSNSVEFADKETKYSGKPRYFTNPETAPTETSTAYNFETFGKYVYNNNEAYTGKADSDGYFYRELKVNVEAEGLNEGCGTYNDPYIIKDSSQLMAVAAFLKNNEKATTLGNVNLPKTKPASFTSGDRWCDGKTAHGLYTANDASFTKPSGGDDWSTDEVQKWLCNAYYKVQNNIELDSTFIGLGGTTANTAFRGVIVGPDSGITITNKSSNPFINVSNGCVVKNITINVDTEITRNQVNNTSSNAYFGYDYTSDNVCKSYGGIIGEVMGGDNIIDNSYVTFGSKVTLSGASGTIVPVGGYVGVIVFGGVIFKNMTADKTTIESTKLNVIYDGNTYNLADNSGKEAWAAIYVNPLVGRVINGYAVNETTQFSVTEDGSYHDKDRTSGRTGNQHTLKNGTKHYSIADINKDEEEKLDVTSVPTSETENGNIDIPNSQAFFILSLITQSCSGTATAGDGDYDNSLSYGTYNDNIYGMSHVADYLSVGSDIDKTDSDYLLASGDTAEKTAVPYIISRYTTSITEENKTTIKVQEQFKQDIKYLDGNSFYISNNKEGSTGNARYLQDSPSLSNETAYRNYCLAKTSNIEDAAIWTFIQVEGSENQFYIKSDSDKYLCMEKYNNNGEGKLSVVTDISSATKFIVINLGNGKYGIGYESGDLTYYINQNYQTWCDRGFCGWKDEPSKDAGSQLILTAAKDINIPAGTTTKYNARCVTSKSGYYDINLTGAEDYQLPDSFRGLGSVGNYDDADNLKNEYCMKVDSFNGNGRSIDEDIYMSKFFYDNYFNVLHYNTDQTLTKTVDYHTNDYKRYHGIGLFDSIIMKDANSSISDFTLSGSVNTEIFDNSYNSKGTEKIDNRKQQMLWFAQGGVVGWVTSTTPVGFSKIKLNDLSVRGSSYAAGLLGYSGNNSTSVFVVINECSADNLSIEMSAYGKEHSDNDIRFAAGAFVGKVMQGGVKIYGTSEGEDNTTADPKEVKLSKFSCPSAATIVAGGLVGYAGHGCQVFDMVVKPQTDDTVINIGENNVSMAGGIVGLMQTAAAGNATCLAKFKNCTVEDINVMGGYAGGLYGGTWNNNWAVYSLSIDNCKVIGNNNKIEAKTVKDFQWGSKMISYAGGFVGKGYVVSGAADKEYNIEIKDSSISGYTITCENTSNSAVGGFIGYANAYSDNSVTCYIHDSSVENCTLGTTNNYAGGAIGQVENNTANKILGYNIKLDTVTAGTSNIGAWIGYLNSADKTTTIQFAGLGIYGSSFSKNVGNNVTLDNATFIFSDYNGKSKTAADEPSVSELNKGTTVDMPKEPYVNIFPQSQFGNGDIISGDGAVLNDSVTEDYSGYTAKNTMAAKIYSEFKNTETDRQYYNTFKDEKIYGENKIDDYMKKTTDDDGDRISTYATERGITLPYGNDFACLVIANSVAEETTEFINRYIQLVTNTPNTGNTANFAAENDYYKVDIKTCTFDSANGTFNINVDQTSGTAGLIVDNDQFKLNPSYADSLYENTFTLLDVQFLDPLGMENIAYHLYVPVYTIREMSVNFYAVAKTGNHSTQYFSGSNTYEKLMESNCTHADTLNTWMTHYIRYEYQADDINALLNSGNLEWNYKKSVNFQTFTNGEDDQPLPTDTYMTLVDPNGNSDQVYYAKTDDMTSYTVEGALTKNCWKVDLENFKSDDGVNFIAPTFNKMIAKDIKVTANSAFHGSYDLASESLYDVYVINEEGEKQYYSYNSNGTGNYDLSVADKYVLKEDYYLSIYVPKADYGAKIFHYNVLAPNRLNSDNIDYIGDEAPKIRSAAVDQKFDCSILIADLFKQTVTKRMTVKPDIEQITANNKKITVDISAQIEPNSATGVTYLNASDFFHSFYLTLIRNSENGTESDIKGLSESNIQATYKIDDDENYQNCANVDLADNYLNVQTADASRSSELINKLQTGGRMFTVSANIVMDFNEDSITEEFPVREADNEYGVNVKAASNLAYDAETLPYTSMTQPYDTDRHNYYIESVKTATLTYSAKKDDIDQYDDIGMNSKNQSTLGVNGRSANQAERTDMQVNTEAFYNVQSLSDSNNAKTLKLTLELNKKTDTEDGVNYASIDKMENYINGNITFRSRDASATVSATGQSVSVELDANKCKLIGGIYDIEITFNAKTGEGFTEYANYRVNLKAELFKEKSADNTENNVENSVAEDYLIYTNAKINANILADIKKAHGN